MPHDFDTPVPPRRPGAELRCVKCGQRMHLVSIEQHERFQNLDTQSFVCECGATTSAVVARIE